MSRKFFPTDLEKFMELYQSLGITPIVETVSEHYTASGRQTEQDKRVRTILKLEEAGGSDKLVGYAGFGTTIEFDEKGKFVQQGFWE